MRSAAVFHCRERFNTTLVSIHSDFENDRVRLLANLSGAVGSRVHIGLSDNETEGTYVWSDGSSFDYAK